MSLAYLIGYMNTVIKSKQVAFVPRLATLSTAHLGRQYFLTTATSSAAVAVLNKIMMGSPKTAVEIAVVMFEEYGLDKSDLKLRQEVQKFVNLLLAETYEGHVIASNGLVLLPYLGTPPRWYRNLSTTAQANVRKVNPNYQGERCKMVFGAKVPAVIGQTYGGIRDGYLDFSGFGKTRWLSPWTLDAISQRDSALKDIAVNVAAVSEDLEKTRADAKAAREREASTKDAAEKLIASMQATLAEQRLVHETMLANASAPGLAENIQKMVQASVDIAISAVANTSKKSAAAPKTRRTRTRGAKVKLVGGE